MAHVYPAWSPFAYVFGNPVIFVDPDGRSAKSSIGNSQKEGRGWSATNIDLANRFGVFGYGGYSQLSGSAKNNSENNADCTDCQNAAEPVITASRIDRSKAELNPFIKFLAGGDNAATITGTIYTAAGLLATPNDIANVIQSYSDVHITGANGPIRLTGKETASELVSIFEKMGGDDMLKSQTIKILDYTGKTLFFIGAGFSVANGVHNVNNGNYLEAAGNVSDIGMGALGTWGGFVGGGFSVLYFSTKIYYQNGGKERGERMSENMRTRGLSSAEAKTAFSCFVGGTKILMADYSTKNIEDVNVGDLILSVNMKTFELEPDEVIDLPDTIITYKEIRYTYDNGVINTASPGHPFYVKGKGWAAFDIIEAKKEVTFPIEEIKIGDTVFYFQDGVLDEVEILNIEDLNKYVPMYNIEYVKQNKTFFANGILVHNKH